MRSVGHDGGVGLDGFHGIERLCSRQTRQSRGGCTLYRMRHRTGVIQIIPRDRGGCGGVVLARAGTTTGRGLVQRPPTDVVQGTEPFDVSNKVGTVELVVHSQRLPKIKGPRRGGRNGQAAQKLGRQLSPEIRFPAEEVRIYRGNDGLVFEHPVAAQETKPFGGRLGRHAHLQ